MLEKSEAGSTYYKTYFYGKGIKRYKLDPVLSCRALPVPYIVLLNFVISISEHQDWFGVDENLGPLAISIRRERVPHTTEEGRGLPPPLGVEHYMYSLIVR